MSSESFWVAFERELALRAGKRVFSFNPDTRDLTEDYSEPLRLPIFAAYQVLDRVTVRWVVTHMRQERHFDLFAPWDYDSPDYSLDWTVWKAKLEEAVSQGGYVVAFVSKHSIKSEFIREELRLGANRVVLAALDEEGLTYYSKHHPELKILHLKCAPDPMFSAIGHLDKNALDDLIVWLYWMIYRNTRPDTP
jgi:hypothetical protein